MVYVWCVVCAVVACTQLEKAFALFKGPNTHAERYLVFEQWKAFEVEVRYDACDSRIYIYY